MTPPRGVEDAASYRDGPKSSYTYTRPRRPEGRPPYNLPFAPRRGRACPARALSHKHPLTFHIVGRGLDPSACPFPASTRSPFHHPVGAGHARPLRGGGRVSGCWPGTGRRRGQDPSLRCGRLEGAYGKVRGPGMPGPYGGRTEDCRAACPQAAADVYRCRMISGHLCRRRRPRRPAEGSRPLPTM